MQGIVLANKEESIVIGIALLDTLDFDFLEHKAKSLIYRLKFSS
jgi:hypothetical protein